MLEWYFLVAEACSDLYFVNIFYSGDKNIFLKSGSRKWIGFGEVGKVDLKSKNKIIIRW
jgi:hypothetical protein